MKAIVVRQPWATLIALGVKTIETRPSPPNGPMRPEGARGLPGCTLDRGERIAIVAGAQRPKAGRDRGQVGPYLVDIGLHPDHRQATSGEAPEMGDGFGYLLRFDRFPLDRDLYEPLPIGAVVCTVTVEDAAIVTDNLYTPGQMAPLLLADADFGGAPALTYFPTLTEWEWQYSDQTPLGDFTPGRWGWLLTDPQPCEPIPVKGRQGVFELPSEAASRIGGQS